MLLKDEAPSLYLPPLSFSDISVIQSTPTPLTSSSHPSISLSFSPTPSIPLFYI